MPNPPTRGLDPNGDRESETLQDTGPLMRWSGDLAVAPGRLMFSGHLGSAPAHRHAAVQVVRVTHGSIEVVIEGARTPVADVVGIPAGVPHAIVAGPNASGSITYLDSERLDCRPDALEHDPSVIQGWLDHAASLSDLHPALRDALERARQLIRGPLLLTDLAAEVGISPGRLGHLFSDELGQSYGSWRRWARLQQALSEVRNGETLTVAAHAAGFADSAHLTRTCRQMFGITPSEAIDATSQTGRAAPRQGQI